MTLSRTTLSRTTLSPTTLQHTGGGKTTQLRILAGDLEPTTGDVVKSSADLQLGFLRQEFVDELVPTRTLKEELMSVFTEEAQIIADLEDCEGQLEAAGSDMDAMQVCANCACVCSCVCVSVFLSHSVCMCLCLCVCVCTCVCVCVCLQIRIPCCVL